MSKTSGSCLVSMISGSLWEQTLWKQSKPPIVCWREHSRQAAGPAKSCLCLAGPRFRSLYLSGPLRGLWYGRHSLTRQAACPRRPVPWIRSGTGQLSVPLGPGPPRLWVTDALKEGRNSIYPSRVPDGNPSQALISALLGSTSVLSRDMRT